MLKITRVCDLICETRGIIGIPFDRSETPCIKVELHENYARILDRPLMQK